MSRKRVVAATHRTVRLPPRGSDRHREYGVQDDTYGCDEGYRKRAVRVGRCMLPGASMYYDARRALHAACCPVVCCLVHRASCMVHACSEIPTSIVRRVAVAVGSPACGSCSEACGMPMNRASGCCSRAVAAARTAPRLSWGTRRHSATSAASVLGQQRPSEPQYPTAVRYPAAAWYPLGWVRS